MRLPLIRFPACRPLRRAPKVETGAPGHIFTRWLDLLHRKGSCFLNQISPLTFRFVALAVIRVSPLPFRRR